MTNENNGTARVLIAEDDLWSCMFIESIFSRFYSHVEYKIVHNGQDAVSAIEEYEPQLVFMDVSLPIMDGIEASFKIREKIPSCKLVFMSGYFANENIKSRVEQLRDVEYITKPVTEGKINFYLSKIAASA